MAKQNDEGARKLAGELDELNEWLAENDVEHRVVFGKPVTAADVAATEKALAVKLPRAYVDFVTTRGPFEYSGALTGRGEGNDTRLLAPADVTLETLRFRKEMALSRDEEGQHIVDDGIVFCVDPDGEFLHLFVISSAAADGEMPTRPFDYQDLGMNDPWYEGDGSFASVIGELIATVREHALDDE